MTACRFRSTSPRSWRLVSRDLLDHGGAGPFGPAVASAFAKIRALLTPRALELAERMRASVGARTVGAKLQLGAEEHLAEIRGLIDAAGKVRLARDETRWTRWARYSARQDRRMEWEGLVGWAEYEGDLTVFWPYLVFGQWTHVGSGTTFGLGGYRIEP